MDLKQQLAQVIHDNPFYDWKEKDLWLKHIEGLNDEQLQQALSHFENLNNRVDNIPSKDENVQAGLLEILGRLHGKESIKGLIDTLTPEDQEFTDEEWNAYLGELGTDPTKMTMFFAVLGPDGLEEMGEIIFSSYMNQELDMSMEEFTKTMSAISGLKQLIEKANREYMEELKTIFLQELQRKQIEEESSLDRADELTKNFLDNY